MDRKVLNNDMHEPLVWRFNISAHFLCCDVRKQAFVQLGKMAKQNYFEKCPFIISKDGKTFDEEKFRGVTVLVCEIDEICEIN